MLSRIGRNTTGKFVSRTFSRRITLDYFNKNEISVSGLVPNQPETPVKFLNLFLRDADAGETSIDSSSKQKLFSTGDISLDIHANKAKVIGSDLHVDWSDGVRSTFSEKFLSSYATKFSRRELRKISRKDWTSWGSFTENGVNDIKNNIYKVSYDSYMNDPNAFGQTLRKLHDVGLVIITDIPRPTPDQEPPFVESIARQIGYIKQTFYGPSWNIKSVPNAKNIAYTAVYLPMHMDLCYYESPPGLQLLHVIENKATGGESLFADAYAAALHVRATDFEAYKALTEIPFTFNYDNDGHHYYYQRPLIVEDKNSPKDPIYGTYEIDHLNYSPPFQGPIDSLATTDDIAPEKLAAFRRGLNLFENYISDPQNQLELKTGENSCLCFFNRRILHGRREFDQNSGKRWFQGTYLDIDAFNSQLRTVS